jgi:uncharacterized protein with PQ loop repeat
MKQRPKPKKNSNNHYIDRLVYFAAILEPLVTIPQVYIIFHDKSAEGVSLLSWLGFQILTAIWIWYGYVHKDKAILIYQGLFFIFQGMVIIGGIMYGAKWW